MFVAPRSGWTTFSEWIEGHRRAVDAFVAWCRKHREAARELAVEYLDASRVVGRVLGKAGIA